MQVTSPKAGCQGKSPTLLHLPRRKTWTNTPKREESKPNKAVCSLQPSVHTTTIVMCCCNSMLPCVLQHPQPLHQNHLSRNSSVCHLNIVCPLDLKEKRGSFPRRSLKEMPQQGAGNSSKPRSGPAATSIPAGGISAKGRDKPMARHLPEVKTKISLMGVSLTDIPLQGASTSSKPAVRERQGPSVP
jgi:hypothetical protein